MLSVNATDNRIVYVEEPGFLDGYDGIICSELLAPLVSLFNSKGYFVTGATSIHYANETYATNWDNEIYNVSEEDNPMHLEIPCITFAYETRKRLYPFLSSLPQPWVCEFESDNTDDYTVLTKEMLKSGKWTTVNGGEFIDDSFVHLNLTVTYDTLKIKEGTNDLYYTYMLIGLMCGKLYQWAQKLPIYPNEYFPVSMNNNMQIAWDIDFDGNDKPWGVEFMITEDADKYKEDIENKLNAELAEYRESQS